MFRMLNIGKGWQLYFNKLLNFLNIWNREEGKLEDNNTIPGVYLLHLKEVNPNANVQLKPGRPRTFFQKAADGIAWKSF